MKYLTIDNGQGFYNINPAGAERKPVDQINKDDLLSLLEHCLAEDSFEMDAYDEGKLQNKAHQIVYRNIYQKLNEVRTKRVSFSDEKTVLYRSAIEKYSAELSE